MKRFNFKIITAILFIAVGIVIGLAITVRYDLSGWLQAQITPKATTESTTSSSLAEQLEQVFADAAEKVGPAVVNVATERTIVQQPFDPWGGTPFDDFFRHFFEMPPQQYKAKSLGSGVIITDDGYVLTNAHVVENAEVIKIYLLSGEEYSAKKIGIDESTDLAVIKVTAKQKLPSVVLGDSDKIRVGQWCLAVGNPFNLGHTVTAGVISAKGRSNIAGMAQNKYQNFIQTDASINPGNSGGPLVNLRGEVIGINTAIYSQTGGSIGIGFAIPINMGKRVIDDLIKTGKVSRPQLGVIIQDLTPELAKGFKVQPYSGVLIGDVSKGSPAEKAGIKSGDIVLKVDDKPVIHTNELQTAIINKKIGDKVKIALLRDGNEKTIEVKLEKKPDTKEKEESSLKEKESEMSSWLGIEVETLTAGWRQRLRVAAEKGVVITKVSPDGKAASVGIQPGDVILQMNKQPITSIEDYKRILKKLSPKDGILLLMERSGYRTFVVIEGE